tara:strand:- start:23024 stop:23236 length:213 start_codon:yes stop_codon:yes gene_type:complete
MFDRFKNLDKKQKLELYKALGWSVCALIGGAGGANQIGVGADLRDIILGWIISLVIIFVVFKALRVLKIN